MQSEVTAVASKLLSGLSSAFEVIQKSSANVADGVSTLVGMEKEHQSLLLDVR